jgi:hypothetical protein
MIDLSTISPDVLNARGCYSTVRAEHEDAKHVLQKQCGDGMSLLGKILKCGTSDDPADIIDAIKRLTDLHLICHAMRDHLEQMGSLAEQRIDLKVKAWSKS